MSCLPAPEWNEDIVSAVSLVYDQWLAVLRTEKSHLYHKERKLLDNIKWVESVAQEMRDAQLPLLRIFARPSEPDISTLVWKPKAVTQVEMGTKLPKAKPANAAVKIDSSEKKTG